LKYKDFLKEWLAVLIFNGLLILFIDFKLHLFLFLYISCWNMYKFY